MGEHVKQAILKEFSEANYYLLIIGSTPDISFIDQLPIVVRYCFQGSISERFLGLRLPRHTVNQRTSIQ